MFGVDQLKNIYFKIKIYIYFLKLFKRPTNNTKKRQIRKKNMTKLTQPSNIKTLSYNRVTTKQNPIMTKILKNPKRNIVTPTKQTSYHLFNRGQLEWWPQVKKGDESRMKKQTRSIITSTPTTVTNNRQPPTTSTSSRSSS